MTGIGDAPRDLSEFISWTRREITALKRRRLTGGITSVDWDDILDKPATFPPSTHTQPFSTITGEIANTQLPTRLREHAATVTDWNSARANGWYMGASAANAPEGSTAWHLGYVEAHNDIYVTQTVHRFASGDGASNTMTYRRDLNSGTWGAWYKLQLSQAEQDARYALISHTHAWADITGKPTTFPPSAHTHAAGDVTSGTFAAARLPQATDAAIGAAELATQAEVNAGTDTTRIVTPATLRNSANLPYAIAAGSVSAQGSGGGSVVPVYYDAAVSVTFPAGRFSQVPRLVATVNAGSTGGVAVGPSVAGLTTSGFTVRATRLNAAPSNSMWTDWVAIQMTSGAASG